jgi:UDP-N-acetylmuramoyl-tripeptide--D-alanyl-D-alanine ligase
MRLTIQDIVEACYPIVAGGGEVPDDFHGVSTDTRTIQPGDLFVALKSEKADGHEFVGQAIEKGASAVMVTSSTMSTTVPALIVDDTQVAYGQIARVWRDKFDIPVIGVTGSVGKTTTKEMLTAALSPLGSILKTAASQNNETGVPKALLQLTDEHKSAVVEMGMRGVGQIEYLCGIARPTIGLISLISDNHIELLGSRDAIADAKGELIDALQDDGTAFLNANDPYFPRLAAKTKARIVGFAVEGESTYGNADFVARNLRLVDGAWTFDVDGQTISLKSPGRHDVSNAVSAYAVAVTLGVKPADAAAALAAYEPPPMRMEIVETPWGGTIINDAYNAAPASMKSALETLKAYPGGRKIAFLGDMKELGDVAADAHAELGRVIESLGGLDEVYTVGELAAGIDGAGHRFENSNEAAQFAADELDIHAGDVVLVKGSRAMKMELVARALTERNTKIG